MKHIFLILLFLMLPFGLCASDDGLNRSKGTEQEAITKLTPSPAQMDVSRYTTIEVTFTVPLRSKYLKKHNIKLQRLSTQANGMIGKLKSFFPKTGCFIDGTFDYDKTAYRLTFTPLKPLEPGMYEVEIKNLKTDKVHKATKIKQIRYRFIVVKELLESITIIPGTVDVKEGSTVQLQALGHYDNGSEKNLTSQVEWSVSNSETAEVDANGTLKALKESSTTVTALLNSVDENISVVVYKELYGYRLPPEPDPVINNATLLGIDRNNNGVRDDVERWILEKFSKDIKYPKIKIAIALQWAEANQQMIKNPTKEGDYLLAKASACQWYWLEKVTEQISNINEAIEFAKKNEIYQDEFEDKIFNTKSRIAQRFKFLNAIGGSISSGSERNIINCNTNIDELGEMK